MGVFEAEFTQVVLADVLDVPGGRVEPQPAFAIDIGNPQRPLGVEDVGLPVMRWSPLFPAQRDHAKRLPILP